MKFRENYNNILVDTGPIKNGQIRKLNYHGEYPEEINYRNIEFHYRGKIKIIKTLNIDNSSQGRFHLVQLLDPKHSKYKKFIDYPVNCII